MGGSVRGGGGGGGGNTGDVEVGFVEETVFDRGMLVMIPVVAFTVLEIPLVERRPP